MYNDPSVYTDKNVFETVICIKFKNIFQERCILYFLYIGTYLYTLYPPLKNIFKFNALTNQIPSLTLQKLLQIHYYPKQNMNHELFSR